MDPYALAKPLLFALPAETAHDLVRRWMAGAQGTPIERTVAERYRVADDRLAVSAFGLDFPNPVGVAAGFDKNAEVPGFLAALGFGHVELGAVTAEAQPGNDRPRLFRLPEDRALVNRMGFNNRGADRVAERLAESDLPDVPVGLNIGKSKVTPLAEASEDYAYTFERCGKYVDYAVVNVSSPNTPGLRELQNREHLEAIVGALRDAGADPLLVKLSPDLAEPAIEAVIEVVETMGLDGIIATNTTTDRPASLQNPHAAEEGGLSGAPIEEQATAVVRFVATRTDVPVIGVGGVDSPEAAYRKIRAGASLVQLYTALIYEGPGLARDINLGLLTLLERDGFDSVTDAVGADL